MAKKTKIPKQEAIINGDQMLFYNMLHQDSSIFNNIYQSYKSIEGLTKELGDKYPTLKLYLLKSLSKSFFVSSEILIKNIESILGKFKTETINKIYPEYFSDGISLISEVKNYIRDLETPSDIEFLGICNADRIADFHNRLYQMSSVTILLVPKLEKSEKEYSKKRFVGYVIAFLIPILAGLLIYGVKVVYEKNHPVQEKVLTPTEIQKTTN